MDVLTSLLLQLSSSEIEKVSEGQFLPREREVFDYIIASLYQLHARKIKSTGLKQSGLTPGHFRKIKSSILKKCYDILSSGDEIELFHFLVEREKLQPHALTLLQKIEPIVSRLEDPIRKEKFYNRAYFFLYRKTQTDPVLMNLFERVHEQLKLSLPLSAEESKLYLELSNYVMLDLFFYIGDATKELQYEEAKKAMEARIAQFESQITENSDPRIRCTFYAIKYYYTQQVDHVNPIQLTYLLKIHDLAGRMHPSLGRTILIWSSTRKAYMYLITGFRKEALEEFIQVLAKYELVSLKDQGMLLTASLIAMTEGRQDLAKKWLRIQETPRPYFDNIEIQIGKAYYSLLYGNLDEAEELLESMIAIKKNWEYSLRIELEIRNIELLIAFRKGNNNLAVNLADRNRKYLNKRGFSLSRELKEATILYEYVLINIILKRMALSRIRNETLPDDVRNFIKEHFSSKNWLLASLFPHLVKLPPSGQAED